MKRAITLALMCLMFTATTGPSSCDSTTNVASIEEVAYQDIEAAKQAYETAKKKLEKAKQASEIGDLGYEYTIVSYHGYLSANSDCYDKRVVYVEILEKYAEMYADDNVTLKQALDTLKQNLEEAEMFYDAAKHSYHTFSDEYRYTIGYKTVVETHDKYCEAFDKYLKALEALACV